MGVFDVAIPSYSHDKPLPPVPTHHHSRQQSNQSLVAEYVIKRTCMSSLASLLKLEIDVRRTFDATNRLELTIPHQSDVGCVLCDAQNWIFVGSEYDPAISLLYARNDGCLSSTVILTSPKFIVPWRYKNKHTGSISWKIIHQTGEHIKDAECETIVINTRRDHNLVRWIEMAKQEAKTYSDAALVERILQIIQAALGSYGIARGATSTEADESLYYQMKEYTSLTQTSKQFHVAWECQNRALQAQGASF